MKRGARTLSLPLSLAPFALVAALGACRGVLGIDEDVPLLPEGAGEGGVSGDGAGPGPGTEGGPGADAGADVAVGFDAAFDAGVTAVDRRYAVWPLPSDKPLLSDYVLTTDTVTDKTTGLEWQRRDAVPATMAYAIGKAYCDDLDLGGQTDWRLPTRIETLTILDYGQAQRLLNNTVFVDGALPGAPSHQWTDSVSLLRQKLDDRLTVDVLLGLVEIASTNANANLVRCVRGGPTTSPVTRYDVAGGAARDVRTGVVWQVTPMATTMLLADAKIACQTLSVDGVGGWRLPNVRELVSLVDESREVAPLVPALFAAGPTARYWSSTTRANPATANFAVDFGTANVHQEELTVGKMSVRCVR